MQKAIVCSCLLGVSSSFSPHVKDSARINDVNHVNYLNEYNAKHKLMWVAGLNGFFEGWTFSDARQLLGTELMDNSSHTNHSRYTATDDSTIPQDFDARAQWPGLIHPIRNQRHCGSCWAFSSSEVLSDRFAIATNQISPVLSTQDMVSCDSANKGCHGGNARNSWQYFQENGVVTDTCLPYTSGSYHGAPVQECVNECADGEPWTKYFAASAYPLYGVDAMQRELVTNGPIQLAYQVYKSFHLYRGGVYQKPDYEFQVQGGHAVKGVGYGTDSGTDYWLIANSWGPSWGEEGFFRILRGSDECDIESRGPPYAGMPAVESPSIVV